MWQILKISVRLSAVRLSISGEHSYEGGNFARSRLNLPRQDTTNDGFSSVFIRAFFLSSSHDVGMFVLEFGQHETNIVSDGRMVGWSDGSGNSELEGSRIGNRDRSLSNSILCDTRHASRASRASRWKALISVLSRDVSLFRNFRSYRHFWLAFS